MNFVIPVLLALCHINHAAGYVIAEPENHPTLLKEIFPEPQGPAVVGRPVDAGERTWMTREVAEDFDVAADPEFDPRMHSNSRIFGFKINKRKESSANSAKTGATTLDNSNDGTSTSDGVPAELDFSSARSDSDAERKEAHAREEAIAEQNRLNKLDPSTFYKRDPEEAHHSDTSSTSACEFLDNSKDKRAAPKYLELSGTDDSDRPVVLPDNTFMTPEKDTKYYEWSQTEDTGESEEEEIALAQHTKDYFWVGPPCGKNSPEDKLPCRILKTNPHPGIPVNAGDPNPQPGFDTPAGGLPGAAPPAGNPPSIPAPGAPPHVTAPAQDDPWVPAETHAPAADPQPAQQSPAAVASGLQPVSTLAEAPFTNRGPSLPAPTANPAVEKRAEPTDVAQTEETAPPIFPPGASPFGPGPVIPSQNSDIPFADAHRGDDHTGETETTRGSQKPYLPIPKSGPPGNDWKAYLPIPKSGPPGNDWKAKAAKPPAPENDDELHPLTREELYARLLELYLALEYLATREIDPAPSATTTATTTTTSIATAPATETLPSEVSDGFYVPEPVVPKSSSVPPFPFSEGEWSQIVHGKPARGGERWDNGLTTFVTSTRTARGAEASA